MRPSIYMKYEASFKEIVSEIINYNGNFGDPIIDHINFDPLELLKNGDKRIELGAGIGLLVNFTSHVDNATFSDALAGKSANDLRQALDSNYCVNYPFLVEAFEMALRSEIDLHQGLKKLYEEYLLSNA